MPPELQNIESCELVHSSNKELLGFKFENDHADQDFQVDLFQSLSAEMKDSRLLFDCGDEFVNKYVHRTMWECRIDVKLTMS